MPNPNHEGAGSPKGGEFSSSPGAGGVAAKGGKDGKAGGKGSEAKDGAGNAASTKSDLAKATYKPSTAAKQAIADKQEAIVSKGLGMPRTKDNSAFDLRTNKVGVEIKTLIDNKNDKITMHPESRNRKLDEAKKDGLRVFTVVVDTRTPGSSSYYVATGVGSFRIGSMQKVGSLAELSKIVK